MVTNCGDVIKPLFINADSELIRPSSQLYLYRIGDVMGAFVALSMEGCL